MFGRVRVSSSSPDELERPTAKLLKHDSLSIYESTLLKLRMGSQHAKCAPPPEDMHTEEDDGMDMEVDSNSASTVCPEAVMSPRVSTTAGGGGYSRGNTLPRSSGCPATLSSKRHSCSSKKISVHHLFSRYKDSKAASSSYDQMMTRENNHSSSVPSNPGKHLCPLNMDQRLEPDCISSITVGTV